MNLDLRIFHAFIITENYIKSVNSRPSRQSPFYEASCKSHITNILFFLTLKGWLLVLFFYFMGMCFFLKYLVFDILNWILKFYKRETTNFGKWD